MFRFLFGKSRPKAGARTRPSGTPTRSQRGIRPKTVTYQASQLPQQLGILAHIPLQSAVARLERSLPSDFVERVRYRIQAEHPQMSDDEFACKWFELKRFFIMNALLKRTPMFSSAIDDIWHAMLMFTREYQRFGEQFVGEMIHHSPEREPKQMPGERSWFDWVYAHLFEFAPASSACWNGFFKHPLDKERTRLLLTGSETEIAESLFDMSKADKDPDIAATIMILVKQAMSEARKSEASETIEETGWSSPWGTAGGMMNLAAAMLFFSMADDQDYSSGMDALQPPGEEDPTRKESNCSSSGCAGSSGDASGFCSSGDDGGGSGCSSDSGGGSSGCSSGSSCSSSSCSSSSCSSSSCGSGCSS